MTKLNNGARYVPTRDRNVLITRTQLDFEAKLGKLRQSLKADTSLTLLKVVEHVREGKPQTEGMWACVFNWMYGKLSTIYKRYNWKRRLNDIDELVLLFFENIPNYLDISGKYYIQLWYYRLPVIFTNLELHKTGMTMPADYRYCALQNRKNRVDSTLGSGGLFSPMPETRYRHLLLVLKFLRDNGGHIDIHKFTKWYLEQAKPPLNKGLEAVANFQELCARIYKLKEEQGTLEWKNELTSLQ